MLDAGTKLGRYEIRSKIGEGGMGEVYLAEDTILHRRVAIKFLPTDSPTNQNANQRLLREAQAAAKLDHPNICAVYEVAETDGRAFIVMSYVDGETLDVRMKRKPLESSESLKIAAQVADAIAEAHAQGIVHRDIKPSNVMITPRGQAKVMDFGLAKFSQTGAAVKVDAEAPTQAQLTTPGTILGTVPYMSPEQVHGKPLDARSDIFSFGVVLYEMLTGQQPFAAESAAGTISAILTREPPPLLQGSDKLQGLVRKCLAKDLNQRYQSMRDVANDLDEAHREGASTSASRSTTTEDRGTRNFFTTRRASIIGVVLILAVIVSASVWLWRRSRGTAPANTKSVNSNARDLYLRGKLNNLANRERNEEATNLLEQAVKVDPDYAPAWAELARAYIIKLYYFASSDEEKKKLNEDAKFAVEKSLVLDPNLAIGHSVRANVLWTEVNRFPHEQAIQAFRRALDLDPNLLDAHEGLASIYQHIGLLEKANEQTQKSAAINPTDNRTRSRVAMTRLCGNKYEEALAILKTVPVESNPDMVTGNTGMALLELGRTAEASNLVDEYLKSHAPTDSSETLSVKAMILAKLGKAEEAEDVIQQSSTAGKGLQHFHHTSYNLASAYALMNKADEAMKWLQFTADDGFPCYPLFADDRQLDNLRKDVRFIAFLSKQKQQWERYKALFSAAKN